MLGFWKGCFQPEDKFMLIRCKLWQHYTSERLDGFFSSRKCKIWKTEKHLEIFHITFWKKKNNNIYVSNIDWIKKISRLVWLVAIYGFFTPAVFTIIMIIWIHTYILRYFILYWNIGGMQNNGCIYILFVNYPKLLKWIEIQYRLYLIRLSRLPYTEDEDISD